MKLGLLFFHQGWTDIFNSLGLIGWYLKTYDKLKILIRMDAMPLMDFYCQQFGERVELEFLPKELLDRMDFLPTEDGDLLIHGMNDTFRTDTYKDVYRNSNYQIFVNTFYTLYTIPATARINDFQIERDLELEDEIYTEFIKRYGTNYRLYHTVEPLPSNDPTLQTVDLNQSSDVFFDTIKILTNAKELHLLDSSWAALVYLLDAKYNLFQHIPVYIYCARNYIAMFSDPITLPNWSFHVVAETSSV
jgi:hypothetical protein